MIITIHQPDFMPWYGFFNKISKVDTWVVLDHVHNNPRKAFGVEEFKFFPMESHFGSQFL